MSLVRYGIILLGSGLFERHFLLLEKGLTNIAARRVTGVGRSAGLMILHIASVVASAPNLFILNCALGLDRALRAANSSIRDQLLEWLGREWNVCDWTSRRHELSFFLICG